MNKKSVKHAARCDLEYGTLRKVIHFNFIAEMQPVEWLRTNINKFLLCEDINKDLVRWGFPWPLIGWPRPLCTLTLSLLPFCGAFFCFSGRAKSPGLFLPQHLPSASIENAVTQVNYIFAVFTFPSICPLLKWYDYKHWLFNKLVLK